MADNNDLAFLGNVAELCSSAVNEYICTFGHNIALFLFVTVCELKNTVVSVCLCNNAGFNTHVKLVDNSVKQHGNLCTAERLVSVKINCAVLLLNTVHKSLFNHICNIGKSLFGNVLHVRKLKR